jgi:hypothetical protein
MIEVDLMSGQVHFAKGEDQIPQMKDHFVVQFVIGLCVKGDDAETHTITEVKIPVEGHDRGSQYRTLETAGAQRAALAFRGLRSPKTRRINRFIDAILFQEKGAERTLEGTQAPRKVAL